jgi:hypothetical protein
MDEAKAEIANTLVRFLNSPPGGSPKRAEVVKVFELFKQLDELQKEEVELRKAAPPRELEGYPPRFTAAERENTKRTESLRRAINAALLRFRFTPMLEIGAKVRWIPAGKSTGAVISNFLKMILDALEEGWLGRFRQCLCGQWFFANTNKKSVCSDACRFQKFKQGKDTFNKERAEYMRKYRSNPRVKAKKANGENRK